MVIVARLLQGLTNPLLHAWLGLIRLPEAYQKRWVGGCKGSRTLVTLSEQNVCLAHDESGRGVACHI